MQHIVDNNGRMLNQQPPSHIKMRPRRPWRWVLLIFVLMILGFLGWFGYRAFQTIGKITAPSNSSPIFHFFEAKNELKGEAEGRTNILLLGMGGANHPGGNLTDTIMLLSLDTKNKRVALLSIPRDLRVPIPGFGYDKINSAHSTGEQYASRTGGGAVLAKRTVQEVFGVPVHYYVRLDFTGFQKLIDAIGGVDVVVEKPINDPYYPDARMIGYEPFSISSGPHHLEGKIALKYARSRETTSDFDRARRQQQILQAIKEKAFSLAILGNPKKINELMQIASEHLRTDLSARDIEHLVSIASDYAKNELITRVLDSSPGGPLVSIGGDGGYYLVPRTGNFKELQNLAQNIFNPKVSGASVESARVEIRNSTGKSGIGTQLAKSLVSLGFTVVRVANGDTLTDSTTVVDYTNRTKQQALEVIRGQLGSPIIRTNAQSAGSSVDFLIELGTDYLKL